MVEKQLMSLVNEGDEDASDSEDIFITQNKIKHEEQSDDSSTFSIPLERVRKYGFENWQKMLNDKELHFQKGRTQDAMKKRTDHRFPKLR